MCTGLAAWKLLWKVGQAISEGEASAVLETSGLRDSWREAETRCHAAGQSPWKDAGRPFLSSHDPISRWDFSLIVCLFVSLIVELIVCLLEFFILRFISLCFYVHRLYLFIKFCFYILNCFCFIIHLFVILQSSFRHVFKSSLNSINVFIILFWNDCLVWWLVYEEMMT